MLAPAGDAEKLKTALHYGADAIYAGGSAFSLRAGAKNFDLRQMEEGIRYAHERGKKLYVAANIFAKNSDFGALKEYLQALRDLQADGVIVADPGVLAMCRACAPELAIHLSTQANTTNRYSAAFWADQGVRRIVLARETSVEEIKEIRDYLPERVELEAFVHGAMCISYSGRCLLSNYLTGRESNRGECVQACRWEYRLSEAGRSDHPLTIGQEERGTYLLNSKDLNMLAHLDDLYRAGVTSFKIEGRMKTEYYVASVVNAYRKALDQMLADPLHYRPDAALSEELYKSSHRDYTTGFYYGAQDTVCADTSQPRCDYTFVARVLEYDAQTGLLAVEQRNRFKVGERLEVLSPDPAYHNAEFTVERILNGAGEEIADAKNVQQTLYIPTRMRLSERDILRRRG